MDETYHDYSYLEGLNERINVIVEAVQKLVDYIKPAFEAVSKWFQKFSDWLYQIYLDSGAIYGESREGSYKWYKNLVKENWKQQELAAKGMGYGQEVPLDYLLYLNNKLKRRLN